MRAPLSQLVAEAVSRCQAEGLLRPGPVPPITIEVPKNPAHGDYACNVAMLLAPEQGRRPRALAETIIGRLETPQGLLRQVEIAGPGFINFHMHEAYWQGLLREVEEGGDLYGHASWGVGRRVQVEFVSSNPTGPLHVGHGRGAALGDVIANLLQAVGFRVHREYYINDAGRQIDLLGRSVYLRLQELLGQPVELPEDHYRGAYIAEIARGVLDSLGPNLVVLPEHEARAICAQEAVSRILEGIKEDLADFGVTFDTWFSERTLEEAGEVRRGIEELQARGFIYEKEEALWFRSTEFGDEKDRVVVRSNGETTYFASDIAYHRSKYQRGFERLVNVWGADHHGYVPRMLAAVQALGRPRESLRIIVIQMVSLLRAGRPVPMSTRGGEFVTLREVLDEVGRDAARYFYLLRRADTHLEFDLELAKRQSSDNPVFYVQYAHARICSVFRQARDRDVAPSPAGEVEAARLALPEELRLLKLLGRYPEVVSGAAAALEPHRVTYYLHELCDEFHRYYNHHRILTEDPGLTAARLALIGCIRTVLAGALGLLGVSAPETM